MRPSHRVGKGARRQGRDDAVDPGDAGAHGDQREHVEVQGAQRMVGAHEERPAGPQHHGGRQHELGPVRDQGRDQPVHVDQMGPHLQHENRQGQRQADPEAPLHVDQLRVGRRFGGDVERFQRHAADRAGARADLAHFGMHRAGVDRVGIDGRRRRGRFLQIARRIGDELLSATCGTEEVCLAGMLRLVGRARGIDPHPADRIEGEGGGLCGVVLMGMHGFDFLR